MSDRSVRRAVLLGGTGLIGSHVLGLLAQQQAYDHVTVITRKALTMPATGFENRVMPLTELDSAADAFVDADVFCCLGTTIKQAGSRDGFRQVDFDFVVGAARLAEKQGGQKFICVSAVNSNPRGLAFYTRVKGEMEQAVQSLDIPLVAFMQPSLLRGDRAEFRLGEEIGQWAMALVQPLAAWSKAAWLPIEAETVARAMVAVALGDAVGVKRFRYREMLSLADRLKQEE